MLALGFGETPEEAGQRARTTLLEKSNSVEQRYIEQWQRVQGSCLDLGQPLQNGFDLYRVSTAVLRTHESKRFPGGMIASLSIPWGAYKGDHDVGGYHVVWPRDLVMAAGGLLAAGDAGSARRTLFYLMSPQDADGHWPKNMWLEGTPYWNGIQMDGTAFVILLADLLRSAGKLDALDPWPMVRAAAEFLVKNDPESEQDRWEENPGYSTYTMAVEIAALLAAADFAADRELFNGHPSGSGMPLVWAHAEYVKLARSLKDGRIFDTRPQAVERYQGKKIGPSFSIWRFNHKVKRVVAGRSLRLELLASAVVHWSSDNWKTCTDLKSMDSALGLHYVDLPVNKFPPDHMWTSHSFGR